MTLDEMLARESIRELLARYTMAGDRLHVEAFVAVFTEDGILESDGVPDDDAFRYAGHAALRRWMNRWTHEDGAAARAHQAKFVRHHLATSLITLTGTDTASARTYWTAYTDVGPDHCGIYLDSFKVVRASWLIAHRRVRLDWRAPASLFTSAVTKTKT